MELNLTTGRPAKVISRFALPIIVGNVFQQCYNLVDNIIVGRCVNFRALAGVGATNGLTFFVLGFVLGTTSGFGIYMAQCYGEGNQAKLRRSFATSLLLCLAIGILLTIASLGLCTPMLHLIGTPSDIFDYAYHYVVILYSGILAQMAYNMVANALRAIGDSSTPLYFLIFSSLLNIGLDLLMVARLQLGVEGAAWATVLSQGVSAILCFAYAWWRHPILRLKGDDFRMEDWKFTWQHLRLALPMAIQFSIIAIGLIMLQAALNSFPATYIAGFTVANKIQNIGALVTMAFGTAMATYAGQNYGAHRFDRIRQGVRAVLIIQACVCLVASAVLLLFPNQLTALFVDSSKTDAAGLQDLFMASRKYLFTSAVFFPFLYAIFLYRNVLQGIGQPFWPLMSSIAELIIRALCSLLLPRWWGYNGIVMIDMFAWIGGAAMLYIAYKIKSKKLLSDKTSEA